jgi:hypothetical protein
VVQLKISLLDGERKEVHHCLPRVRIVAECGSVAPRAGATSEEPLRFGEGWWKALLISFVSGPEPAGPPARSQRMRRRQRIAALGLSVAIATGLSGAVAVGGRSRSGLAHRQARHVDQKAGTGRAR